MIEWTYANIGRLLNVDRITLRTSIDILAKAINEEE